MKTLEERIEIETAYLNGESVEYRTPQEYWLPLGIPKDEMVFYWQENDYRIKPEPIELMVDAYNDGGIMRYEVASDNNRKTFNSDCSKSDVIKTIKVREVTE